MPDYDVQAVGLAVPAVSAPVTTYRPAVTIRNNGIHPANVTGICRMYRREQPGDLLQTWNIYLSALAAGNTGLALADGYWIPVAADIGRQFLFTADIVAEHDQVKTNDHLAPITVIVTAGEPPTPPIVTDHATQHEEGGTDEVNVDGLSGELKDDQPAKDHAGKHEQGGADELNVANLHGQLADPQPVSEHGNEAHDPAFLDAPAAAAAIAEHDEKPVVHEETTNLELIANKGTPSGYAPLDASSVVPAENIDLSLYEGALPDHQRPAYAARVHPEPEGLSQNETGYPSSIAIPANNAASGDIFRLKAFVLFYNQATTPPTILLQFSVNGGQYADILTLTPGQLAPSDADFYLMEINAEIALYLDTGTLFAACTGHVDYAQASNTVNRSFDATSAVIIDPTKTLTARLLFSVPDYLLAGASMKADHVTKFKALP